MSTRERAASAHGEVLSFDALRPLNVTEVAEFVFCKRKGALVSHHIHGDASSPSYALGTIQHELRHRVLRHVRQKYLGFSTQDQVGRFADGQLLDVILGASAFVRDLARATHPLYVDKIQEALDQLEPAILDEEGARAVAYGNLLANGSRPSEAVNRVMPVEIEHGLGSSQLRLKGRVDQIWLRDGKPAPVDLKTHGPELRRLFEESHWMQVALYGILLEERGDRVSELGLHYTYLGEPEFRAFDDELRARALAALRDARRLLVRGGIPPVPDGQDKCNICLHRSRCFGPSRVDSLAPLSPPSSETLMKDAAPEASAEEKAFSDFLRGLSRFLRRGRASRRDVDEWVKSQRHAILARHATSPEAKIAVRRLLKAFERLIEQQLAPHAPPTHDAMFGGSRIEASSWPGCVYVVARDEVIPWIYVGLDSGASVDREVADRCFAAERDIGLPCQAGVRVDQNGRLQQFPFDADRRKQWASRLVSRRAEPDLEAQAAEPGGTLPAGGDPAPAGSSGEPPRGGGAGQRPERTYVGWISEDRSRPLKFGVRGDRVFGFVREEHRDKLAKEDYVVAERVNGTELPPKRIFLRVLEIKSAPLSAGTRTKSVNELGTEVLFEPLWEHHDGEDQPRPAANDDWNGYQIRCADAEEVRRFLALPATGMPLGRLAARGEPVTVNFPFEPPDALFRSFFVVGAKGKGKTSFVRALSTLATTYLAERSEERPAIIILDGEPNSTGDSCEFGSATLHAAHERLGEQIGPTLLDRPAVQEIVLNRNESGLAFSYGDIKVEDIILLLPPLTETSANVLRRVLKQMAEQKETPLRSLKDALEYLRRELGNNGQVDQRTARAIAERLMSPQVEVLEDCAPDAVAVRSLLRPGTISVLNVVDLDDDQRKVVALYLLLAFEKLAEQKGGINALLVLDEGEKLFPNRRGGSATPTTVQRLATRVAGIARRGRRRRFGMMVCTQTPRDVHGEIVANCDVKLTFNVSGQDAWLRENVGADLVQSVKSLATGECYVDLRKVVQSFSKPVRTRLFAT
jgi:DNA helicase HerA-like ATPase/CRISPR/Cas system-associated exonuclease Cas4 (RecB family)